MIFDNDALNMALWAVAALAALNVGMVAAIDYNLLTDLLQLGTDMEQYAEMGMGVAGALGLVSVVNEVA